MRKPRDAEDTVERVLEAAQTLFAEKGFAGTSLAMISEKCGISDGLILHHFKSKKNLYHQVLESQADRYTQSLVQARDRASNPEEMMTQMLSASFNFWKNDEIYNRLSLWAYLENQTELASKEVGLTAGLFQGIVQLQTMKLIDATIDPLPFLTMVIGSIHFWIRYRNLFKVALNRTETLDELDEQFLEGLGNLILKLIRKPA
jgi:TetR/AcrR family transcriptional regulator